MISPLETSEPSPAVHGAIDLADDSVEFVVAVENIGNKRIRFDRSVRPSFKLDLHVFLSRSFLFRGYVLSTAEAIHGFVGFFFGFFLTFGFAPVVELLAFRNSQLAFRNAVAKINLQRDYRHALLLRLNQEAFDLAPVEQQLCFRRGS